MTNIVYDLAGVGFGPANIALSVYLQETESKASRIFFDRRSAPSWQSEMLLSGSDIQNNPLRDFVTPRNPRSHFTFVNYLKEQGRLFEYLNLPVHYPLRREYAGYIDWVADHFAQTVKKGVGIAGLDPVTTAEGRLWKLTGTDGSTALARKVVVGTGRSPNIPDVFQPVIGPSVFHLTEFLSRLEALPDVKRIGVLGASQSAVEILLYLHKRYPHAQIYSIQRSFAFRLKDVSPFSDRVYFPEFVDYFYDLPQKGKENINRQLRATNYSSADGDVLDALYMTRYEDDLAGEQRIHLLNNTAVTKAGNAHGQVQLALQEVNTGEESALDLDALVLATGFLDLSAGALGEKHPPLLSSFVSEIETDADGVIQVTRDYRVKFRDAAMPPLFLNGLCEATHGFGDAGSFSLLSVRSEIIGKALAETCGDVSGEVVNDNLNRKLSA